ncbi:MAG: divergent polysaccharide deacetylase family protein [Alphaproteobacteria bacterium]|nr:divergent polysaccharide deacetylase family protein [Alphaproteobacteria bacterium]
MSRRKLLLSGLGALVAGAGIGGVMSRGIPNPAADKPFSNRAVEAPVPPPATAAMEEAPLPADIYVPPPAPVAALAPPAPVALPPPPAAPSPRPAAPLSAPTWLRNARPFLDTHGTPAVAVVIDDLGLDQVRTGRAIALDGTVTLAFMTYAERLAEWTAAARAARHEYLVHVPMQPESATVDPGPNALTTTLPESEIRARLRWGLERMEGYVGANNHMGSRFTANAAGMRVVMEELKTRGLLFLDSRTTPRTTCASLAATRDLPFASRNVFLDNEPTMEGVRKQIAELEAVARKQGTAIGIGHPHEATLAALAQWLPAAASRGIAVVPLTSVMRRSPVPA